MGPSQTSAHSVVLSDACTGRERHLFHPGNGEGVWLAAGGNTLVAANDTPELRLKSDPGETDRIRDLTRRFAELNTLHLGYTGTLAGIGFGPVPSADYCAALTNCSHDLKRSVMLRDLVSPAAMKK